MREAISTLLKNDDEAKRARALSQLSKQLVSTAMAYCDEILTRRELGMNLTRQMLSSRVVLEGALACASDDDARTYLEGRLISEIFSQVPRPDPRPAADRERDLRRLDALEYLDVDGRCSAAIQFLRHYYRGELTELGVTQDEATSRRHRYENALRRTLENHARGLGRAASA